MFARLLLAGAAVLISGPALAAPSHLDGDRAGCPAGKAVETAEGGRWLRKLALLIGSGEHVRLPDLGGPALDVRYMYRLLTDPAAGYGFPRENVCVLVDEQATLARVRSAFRSALVERARDGDVVVIYYSGYGSQVHDPDGDEADGLDESLLLYDSRRERPRKEALEDLTDDELNTMIGELYARAGRLHTALIVDASIQWNFGDLELRPGVRFLTPRDESGLPEPNAPDRNAYGLVSPRPGLVAAVAASTDSVAFGGTVAPNDGGGLFTAALVRAASRAADPAPAYRQLARAIVPLAGARSRQMPVWQGALDQRIFGAAAHPRPLAPEITRVGKTIELTGAELPGVGPGAILRVREAVTGADARDPRRAVGKLRVTAIKGHTATAVRLDGEGAPPLAPGQLATLLRPSAAATTLRVRLRPEPEIGGLDRKRARALARAFERHDPILEKDLALVADARLAHEVALTYDKKQLQLLGPAGDVRRSFTLDADVELAEALVGLIRQQVLLQLEPEPAGTLAEHETIEARVVEGAPPPPDAPPSPFGSCWPRSEWNGDQRVPMCRSWKLDVLVRPRWAAPGSPELELGGLVMTSGGEMYPLFADEGSTSIRPANQPLAIDPELTANVPIDTRDYVLLVGSREQAQIPWSRIAEPSPTARAGTALTPLAAELFSLLDLGTASDVANRTPWTWTVLPVRSVTATAAADFGATPSRARIRSDGECREFTIPSFDITPYLPPDPEASLYKVLQNVHRLTTSCLAGRCGDGAKYEQKNPWTGTRCGPSPTDDANLMKGIDCSRAIWFVFTRAGLPYIRGEDFPGCYIATSLMSGPASPMAQSFTSCMRDPIKRIGDVLVYRNEAKNTGHVVMLIDPARRVVWGSHAFGGTPGGDTGVEYQVMALKHSLRMFDGPAHRLTGCWRHKQLAKEMASPGGRPRGGFVEEACGAEP